MTAVTRRTPFLLAILDGLALNPNPRGNAVFHAKKPTLEMLLKSWPSTTLTTHGLRVGLPQGQMGNSEVGHLNIGAGRIVMQDLTRISLAVEQHAFGKLPALASLCASLRATPGRALHIIALMSRGGVHSSLEHILEIVRTAIENGVPSIFLHAITDGRDRPPQASIEELGSFLDSVARLSAASGSSPSAKSEVALVSICGRYFAMDRDNRWERTERAYRLYTEAIGEPFTDPLALIASRHERGETDEFLTPATIAPSGASLSRSATIQSGDAVIFGNFRADRMRQIVSSFLPGPFTHFSRDSKGSPPPELQRICTLTAYEKDLPVEVLFAPQSITHHFGNVVADAGLRQLRIAETEKYAHVTYFFNGGVEAPCSHEERILVPSPRDVPTYDLKPEMSAVQVTDRLIESLEGNRPDVIVLNYANCDMVGHTGNFDAAVQAVETVDRCLSRVLTVLDRCGGSAIITADHGNADQMIDYETGEPHTYHTLHPVPCIVYGKDCGGLALRDGGALCDIAPTACELLGLPKPCEMSGTSLLVPS